MVAQIKDVKPRTRDLLKAMAGGKLYREAYAKGVNLSRYLEMEDPSEQYKDGLDAFERMTREAGIITNSMPAYGVWADEFGAFDKTDEARALVPEWMNRQWRKVQFANHGERAILTSDLEALGTAIRPYSDNPVARSKRLAPAIPLSELVAFTTPIDSASYRAVYFTEPTVAEARLPRVSQGGELPRVKLTAGERDVALYKYGRALEMTYEMLRRQRIDKVAFWVQRAAIQAETDKVAQVIDVIVNGDGNAGTAATEWNLIADLDSSATADTISLKSWLNFKMKFTNPYTLTTVLAQADEGLQLMLLNLGSANIPLAAVGPSFGFGGFTPINPELRDNVRLGITDAAPAGKMVALDARLGIERVTEIGSDISEVERWAIRQVQVLTFSEVEGYAVIDQNALKIFDVDE